MTLPYVRTIQYLSPSSLSQLEESPLEFYLRRLGPEEFKPADSQTFQMATGTAFDAAVKRALGATIDERITTVDRPGEARQLGETLAARYIASPAWVRLQSEHPTVGTRLERELWGVPVSGELDLTLQPKRSRPAFVCDWKVTGSGNPGSISPNKGYRYLTNTLEPEKPFGPHVLHASPLELLNDKWSTQLAIYGFLLHGPVIRTRRVALDQIVCWHEGHLRIAQFRTTISAGFQRAVRKRLQDAWQLVCEERVVPPEIAEGGVEFVRTCA